MNKTIIAFILIIINLSFAQKIDDKFIGAKIYSTEYDFDELFDKWDDLGFNTAFVSVDLLKNDTFRSLAEQNGIKLFVIFPTFYNPDALKDNPNLYAIQKDGRVAKDEWVEFVCPNREDYKSQKLDQLREIAKEYSPYAISLDFIRYFVFWEKVYPETLPEELPRTCFCDTCVVKFCNEKSIELPKTINGVSERAQFILDNYEGMWNEWRAGVIADFISRAVETIKTANPKVKVNLHALPWNNEDYNGAMKTVAAQDLEKISEIVDYISPMYYSHMVKRNSTWLEERVKSLNENISKPILPSIQVGKAYLDEDVLDANFEKDLALSLKYTNSVIFWNWDALDKSNSKKIIVKKYVK